MLQVLHIIFENVAGSYREKNRNAHCAHSLDSWKYHLAKFSERLLFAHYDISCVKKYIIYMFFFNGVLSILKKYSSMTGCYLLLKGLILP